MIKPSLNTMRGNPRVTWRPLESADIDAFCDGVRPDYADTAQGLTFFLDGKLAGIAGAADAEGSAFVFSNKKDWATVPKITIWCIACLVLSYIGNKPVVALAENENLLKRLGFTYLSDTEQGPAYFRGGV